MISWQKRLQCLLLWLFHFSKAATSSWHWPGQPDVEIKMREFLGSNSKFVNVFQIVITFFFSSSWILNNAYILQCLIIWAMDNVYSLFLDVLLPHKNQHFPTFKLYFMHTTTAYTLLISVWKRIGVNSEFHIPIPILWNWFLECPNSNSSSGIVASTPIPTQWNWGDSTGIPISKFPTLCSPLKRRKRQLETPSSLLFSNFFSFSKGYRAWEILKSESQWNLPNSVESELELKLQFHCWSWNWGIPKANSKELHCNWNEYKLFPHFQNIKVYVQSYEDLLGPWLWC